MKTSGLSDRHVVRLFTRMAHLYGHKWVSVYGDAVANGKPTASARQWLYDLRDMTPEQVALGVAETERRGLEWPPGPIEFKRLCLQIPSIQQLLDRGTDYGPVCAAIRKRCDWFRIEGMASDKARELAGQQLERAVLNMRASGELQALAAPAAREALERAA